MADFVKLCAAADVAPGTGTTIEVRGKKIAVFNVDGAFHAIDDECPHRGGPLGEGELDGCLVMCPWHAWQFDVTTGESVTDDLVVGHYETRVDGGDVLIAL